MSTTWKVLIIVALVVAALALITLGVVVATTNHESSGPAKSKVEHEATTDDSVIVMTVPSTRVDVGTVELPELRLRAKVRIVPEISVVKSSDGK